MLEVEDFSQRGDAPALAIIQDNARKKAFRQVVETQEELTRIHERVTRTIDAYELSEKLSGHQLDDKEVERIAEDFIREQATLEFVDDMTQLLIILSDPVAKRKYQQQVAVFIVGFENLCGRRARLLAQLQEFFSQNGRNEDQFDIEPPDFDIEDVGVQVREALDKAEKATQRLATVSKDVIKALEVANPKETKKGKKKLERALQQAQQDILSLTEKLIRVQNDLEESEGKMSQMYKSMEMKQVEIERLKVQGENAKKANETVKELKVELTVKDTDLQRANKTIQELELNLAHLEDKQERDFERNKKMKEENQKSKDTYEEKIRDQQQYIADLRSELKQHYDEQVKELVGGHQRELTKIQSDHKVELDRMQKALDVARRKSEELKTELSDSSKRNSIAADSGSKRSSLFSPESDFGGETPRKLSMKSSAQAVRLLNKGKQSLQSDGGSVSDLSDSSSTPINKSTTPTQTSPSVEITQEKPGESPSRKSSLSHKESKTDTKKSSAKERNSTGTTEKQLKSKSPDKTPATVEPFEKTDTTGESSEVKQVVTVEATNSQVGSVKVDMVDIGIQSETEDLSDSESATQQTGRKPTVLQVVPEVEEEHEDDDELESRSHVYLIKKLEDYKVKAQERQKKLELELAELKNKYMMKTNSLI
ncbi:bromodomain testis-specific protein-like, partial [Stylophora pistillata]|uniref:bromodomain testis-specific protein-like n=1 Tax=Stylophora pistillata TaxID=50429 RepID=UPI000C04CCCA